MNLKQQQLDKSWFKNNLRIVKVRFKNEFRECILVL